MRAILAPFFIVLVNGCHGRLAAIRRREAGSARLAQERVTFKVMAGEPGAENRVPDGEHLCR